MHIAQLRENLDSIIVVILFWDIFLFCFFKTYLYSKTQEYDGGRKKSKKGMQEFTLQKIPLW